MRLLINVAGHKLTLPRPSRSRSLNQSDWRAVGQAMVGAFGGPDAIPWGAPAQVILTGNASHGEFHEVRNVTLGNHAQ